jgi:hypothetical protein
LGKFIKPGKNVEELISLSDSPQLGLMQGRAGSNWTGSSRL